MDGPRGGWSDSWQYIGNTEAVSNRPFFISRVGTLINLIILTSISLFKVDKNHNSLPTNKPQLKQIYSTLAINLLLFALKFSSDEEFFIAMAKFCYN